MAQASQPLAAAAAVTNAQLLDLSLQLVPFAGRRRSFTNPPDLTNPAMQALFDGFVSAANAVRAPEERLDVQSPAQAGAPLAAVAAAAARGLPGSRSGTPRSSPPLPVLIEDPGETPLLSPRPQLRAVSAPILPAASPASDGASPVQPVVLNLDKNRFAAASPPQLVPIAEDAPAASASPDEVALIFAQAPPAEKP
jgi:hypothetical protein